MHIDGFVLQILFGMLVTIKLAVCALLLGMIIGLFGALLESIRPHWLRYLIMGLIFIIRGLPELLVLFIIYFGLTTLLTQLLHHYVDISAFVAGVITLGLIFGAYAAQVFRGAFLAIDVGQLDAGSAMGLSRSQLFFRIQLPQAWRHAIPGLGNLWLVLLKDTAIVSLIGLSEMMNQSKLAASSTHQPFTFYLIAALLYLVITSVSQQAINWFTVRANRYVHA
jgi:His/Glu/Gln/Arg/opine family amino acid ABC transporter permease subunit